MPKLPRLKDLLEARSSLLDLKMQIVGLQIRDILRKYRSDQPRVPAGNSDGGQWTDDHSGGHSRVAGKYDPKRAAICDLQYDKDIELCRMVQSGLCYQMASERRAACMKNNFLPNLIF